MSSKKKTYKIGLVDADLLCNGTRHPNLALLKLAGYFRDNGFVRQTTHSDTKGVSTYELLTNKSNFEQLHNLDHIYVSCVFSFTLDDPPLLLTTLMSDKRLKRKVHMGGTGSYANLSVENGFAEKREEDMHRLENDVFLSKFENKSGTKGIDMRTQMPDYHLYDEFVSVMENVKSSAKYYKDYKEYSIGFLTRGCFRRCPFCVNKLERKAMPYSNLNDFLDQERDEKGRLVRPYIYLWDDNFLASPYWEPLLDELIATGRPFQFRQGLDERLLAQNRRGEDMARKLANANYHGDFIFAFDNWFDRKLIEKALKMAEVDFIESLDDGVSQGASNYSGGQKQRLQLARSILAKRDFYLFDDCFSALDMNTEAKVKENLKSLKENSSMLIVSQRISTIMDADEIIVLDEGEIIDKGSHDYLNENCKIYREIVSSQIDRSKDLLYDNEESSNYVLDTSYLKKTAGGK